MERTATNRYANSCACFGAPAHGPMSSTRASKSKSPAGCRRCAIPSPSPSPAPAPAPALAWLARAPSPAAASKLTEDSSSAAAWLPGTTPASQFASISARIACTLVSRSRSSTSGSHSSSAMSDRSSRPPQPRAPSREISHIVGHTTVSGTPSSPPPSARLLLSSPASASARRAWG